MKISAIVLHITDGSFESAYNTFMNPDSYVSAHYLIGRDKEVQLVKEEDTAWHAGLVLNPKWKGLKYAQLLGKIKSLEHYYGANRGEQGELTQPIWDKKLCGFRGVLNPNFYTIGVEFASDGSFPGWSFWLKGARFIKELAEKHNLPIDDIHIVDHNKIRYNKECPGKWFNYFWMNILIKLVLKGQK